ADLPNRGYLGSLPSTMEQGAHGPARIVLAVEVGAVKLRDRLAAIDGAANDGHVQACCPPCRAVLKRVHRLRAARACTQGRCALTRVGGGAFMGGPTKVETGGACGRDFDPVKVPLPDVCDVKVPCGRVE